MTGIISGIKRMEIHDGDGIRTTVFFKGCPLKCIWCHNPESISFEPQIAKFSQKCINCGTCGENPNAQEADACPTGALVLYGKEYEVNELAEILKKDATFFRESGGGVTFSGGECLAQPKFAIELAQILSQSKISVYIDTCGFVNQDVFRQIIPFTDVFLYDIKAIDPIVHKMCTGKENKIILSNLKYLSERGCTIDIRYPLIVGYTDGECKKIGEFLKDLPGIRQIKVLRYHSFASSRYDALSMKNTMPQTETRIEDIKNAVNTLKSFGLNAVCDID